MGYIEDTGEDTKSLKKIVRKKVLTLRDNISAANRAEYDARIREIVMGMKEYREAEVILTYVSYKSEVDTTMLIQQALQDGKNVFTPKVSGNEMEFWRITAMEDLREGYRGILEPAQSITFPDWIMKYTDGTDADTDINIGVDRESTSKVCKVMMWMPGAVFDTERHRIGYGGGYYDKYLNRLSDISNQTASSEKQRLHVGHFKLITEALAYHCQILERIPYEEHDVKPDFLITERGIYT